jgi:hypothetical protein
MKDWAAHLRRVTPQQSRAPKRLTLIYPFYENDAFLRQQIAGWQQLPRDLSLFLSVIVVDDGSPGKGAAAAFDGWNPHQHFPVRIFRILEDVRWNWLAARNIGVCRAASGWLLLTDMDHVVPVDTLRSVLYGLHAEGTIYGFERVEHTGEPLHPHPNSWLLTRSMYWNVGGYDERLSGLYGTDGDWRRRCAKTAPMAILTDRLVRYERQGDSSTTRYLRKQPEDAQVAAIVKARANQAPRTLTFPYREVYPARPVVAC